MALWSVLIAPIIVRLTFSSGADFLPSGYIEIRTIGFALRFDWKTVAGEKGLDVVMRYAGAHSKSTHSMRNINRQGVLNAKTVLQNKKLKKELLSYAAALHLQTEVRVGMQDAAATALVCGALSALLGCLPQIRARIIPEFRQQSFCMQAKCIASFRLGKLFASAAIYLRALAMQRMRQKAGGTEYGKSTASNRQHDANGA